MRGINFKLLSVFIVLFVVSSFATKAEGILLVKNISILSDIASIKKSESIMTNDVKFVFERSKRVENSIIKNNSIKK